MYGGRQGSRPFRRFRAPSAVPSRVSVVDHLLAFFLRWLSISLTRSSARVVRFRACSHFARALWYRVEKGLPHGCGVLSPRRFFGGCAVFAPFSDAAPFAEALWAGVGVRLRRFVVVSVSCAFAPFSDAAPFADALWAGVAVRLRSFRVVSDSLLFFRSDPWWSVFPQARVASCGSLLAAWEVCGGSGRPSSSSGVCWGNGGSAS